jgi:Endonuclease/Exonuclease/phosphatase family
MASGPGSAAPMVNLVVTNFSGGKRHSGSDLVGDDGVPELARLANGVRTDSGVVLAIQEMTTVVPGLPTRAATVEQAVGQAWSSYVPRVSTAWYPLVEKWGSEVGASRAHNEGLCVVTAARGLALSPWATLGGPVAVDSPTRVIDLPALEFPEPGEAASAPDWLHATIEFDGVDSEVAFRPTFYQGSRDSDPRAAQACLLAWLGPDGAAPSPACILVNVHLSTLRRENVNGVQGRVPCPEATFQRDLQLRLLARFVRSVQATHDLPVIIAGDFNAEPDSPELRTFAEESDSVPLLRAEVCWNCGARQDIRAEAPFYRLGERGFALTLTPQPTKPVFGPVCHNESCREPRFTHKHNLQLIDNVFVTRARAGTPGKLAPGKPRVELGWAYSDHAAIVVPLQVLHDRGPSETETGHADTLRN